MYKLKFNKHKKNLPPKNFQDTLFKYTIICIISGRRISLHNEHKYNLPLKKKYLNTLITIQYNMYNKRQKDLQTQT